ncbi:MAG: MotE family protein [Rhizobiaceae bacterium]|nr:MotE family protein [Rhizobiaceae bacterium]
MTETSATLRRLTRATLLSAFALGTIAASMAPAIVFAASGAPASGSGTPPEALVERPTKVRVIGTDGKPIVEDAAAASDIERYCTNIADPAKDARAAIQAKRLQELEGEISAQIDALEAKRKEYQDWLQQRQAFIDSTAGIVIDIYAGMKPDAAALQLAGLDRTTAASIVTKLKPRTASAILSEMPPEVAAELANLIVQKTNKDVDVAAAAPGQG